VPPSDRHLYHDFLDFPFFHTHRDTSTLKENYPGIVSVMKDEELKLEEIESSHTLG